MIHQYTTNLIAIIGVLCLGTPSMVWADAKTNSWENAQDQETIREILGSSQESEPPTAPIYEKPQRRYPQIATQDVSSPERSMDAGDEPAPSTELWKGHSPNSGANLSALSGLGIYSGRVGFSLGGAIAFRIKENGFLDDINDEVFFETLVSLMFASGTSLVGSVHMRWDFHKDNLWDFFSFGGLGFSSAADGLGGEFRVAPRFGVGAIRMVGNRLGIRAEISHNLILGGVTLYL